MTRGMFVTVLSNLAQIDKTQYAGSSKFVDVSKDAYYAPCVNWAVKNGIVSGIDAKHFAPEKLITREQAAVMLSNYLSHCLLTTASRCLLTTLRFPTMQWMQFV